MELSKDPLAPLNRFSNKVEYYIKYRPHYPDEIIKKLKDEKILTDVSTIADVGSGTGILTELFLINGNKVFGVEPNKEMRDAGEKLLSNYKNFVSLNGTAESTKLQDKSVDIVTAAQAFHWFDKEKAKAEFIRILRPVGFVVVVWNTVKKTETPFLRAYESLLFKYGIDYARVKHENTSPEVMKKFYDKSGFKFVSFYNEQIFDYDGLKGRLLSASYIPTESQPGYNEMLEELKKVYDENNVDGKVKFEYDTKMYWGNLM